MSSKLTPRDIKFRRWSELQVADLPKVESPAQARIQAEQMSRTADQKTLQELLRRLDPGGGFGSHGTSVAFPPAKRLLDLIGRGEVVLQHGFSSRPQVPLVVPGAGKDEAPQPNPALDAITRSHVQQLLNFRPPAKSTALATGKSQATGEEPVTKSDPVREPKEPKICLLPMRHGLVEKLDKGRELGVPYTLKTRPMGLRLMRNGFVYFIDDKDETVHEFEMKDGWPASDIVFPRDRTFYVAYSEVQWTEDKKTQAKKDRHACMQRLELAKASSVPPKGSHLITIEQAGQWLAEAAEGKVEVGKGLPKGAHEDEKKAYAWEHKPLFAAIDSGAIKAKITGDEKYAYCLVLPDHIGVMRDLAEYQDLVTGWIQDWAEDKETNKKYQLGCYIKSIYAASGQSLFSKAAKDPRLADMQCDLNDRERKAILDYLEERSKYSEGYVKEFFKNFTVAGLIYKGVAEGPLRDAHERMVNTLGKEKYEKYEDVIEEQNDETQQTLYGAYLSTQLGIDDLIERQAMEGFLSAQAAHLKRWHAMLDRITGDRERLLIGNFFHGHAWWFDVQVDEQVEAALLTEYACLKDVCRSDTTSESVAKWLEGNSLANEFLAYTLSEEDQRQLKFVLDKLKENAANELHGAFVNLGALTQEAKTRGSVVDALKSLSDKHKNAVASRGLPAQSSLGTSAAHLNALRQGIYRPPMDLAEAAVLERMMNSFEAGRPFKPDEVLRKMPKAAWLDLLRSYSQTGVSVTVATSQQLAAFQGDVDAAAALRQRLTSLKNQRTQVLAQRRKTSGASAARHRARADELGREFATVQKQLEPIEQRIAQAMNPVGEGPGQVGLRITGVDKGDIPEIRRMAKDFRAGRPPAMSQAKAVAVGDGLAHIVALFQIWSLGGALLTLRQKDKIGLEDVKALAGPLVGTTAATLAALQGATLTRLEEALKHYGSLAGKAQAAARLGRLTAYIGGFGYLFGVAAGGFALASSAGRWDEAMREGDFKSMVGASLSLAGDTAFVGSQGWALARYAGTVRVAWGAARAGEAVWAMASARLASVFFRANLVGLVATGLQLLGEWLYNKYHRTEMQSWLETSPWGKKNAGLSMEEYQKRLRDITVFPLVQLVSEKGERVVEITIPDLSLDGLDAANVKVTAYCQDVPSDAWYGYTEEVMSSLTYTAAAPLRVTVPLSEVGGPVAMAFKLKYASELAPSDPPRELRYQLGSLSIAPGGVKPFERIDSVLYGEGWSKGARKKGFDTREWIEPREMPLKYDEFLLRITKDAQPAAAQCKVAGHG